MKAMKIMIVACVSIIVLLSSCRIETAKDLGPTKTKNIEVKQFDEIELSSAAKVIFHISDTVSVSIEAPEKLIDSYQIESNGKQLSIREKNKEEGKMVMNMGNFSDEYVVTVHVYAPRLSSIYVTGSGEVTCDDTIHAEKFVGWVTGSGDINCKVVKAEKLSLQVTGSGDIELDEAEAVNSMAQVTGSGDIKVHFNNSDTATATITGSGDITFTGTLSQLSKQVSGSGEIDTDKLTVTKK
jgi:hypothetical protein